MSEEQHALREEVRQLREEVARLNNHRFLRTYNSTWKFMAFNFAKGIVAALGGIIGATVVLSWVIWSLSQIEFIPIIGEYAHELIQIVQEADEPAPSNTSAPEAAAPAVAPADRPADAPADN